MKTLTIKDLSTTTELDARAMASVAGGTFKMPYYHSPLLSLNQESFKFEASQLVGQEQNTIVNNGNNVAFASGITANVKPTQSANNTINFV